MSNSNKNKNKRRAETKAKSTSTSSSTSLSSSPPPTPTSYPPACSATTRVLLYHDYNGRPLTWWTGARLFLYWGPLIAEILICGIFLVNITLVVPKWRSLGVLSDAAERSIIRFILVFFLANIQTNFGLAVLRGPGWLATPSAERKAVVDESRLQYCKRCDVYKEARSHHCSVCKRCVCHQDHHCPWINRCVGYANQKNFVLFLFYASTGCLFVVLVTVLCGVYGSLFRVTRGSFGGGGRSNELVAYFAALLAHFAFALGTALALLFLLHWQVGVILANMNDIENWILTKARRHNYDFVFPYAVGKLESWRLIMGASIAEWLLFTTPQNAMYKSMGHEWPLVSGSSCDYYTLYEEQVRQKKQKRAKAIKLTVLEGTTGRYYGLGHGIGVCRHYPSCCDPYARVVEGEEVDAMYGTEHWTWIEVWRDGIKERKGWVPRMCVDDTLTPNDDTKQSRKKTE